MAFHNIDPLLERIRIIVAETEQLEGDGADETALGVRRHELAQLKSLLANVVSHDPTLDYHRTAA
jgi:hypothetical protein